ncbi:hypothetical protein FSHL1_012042 [Fusarium sambucinum]
MFRRERRSDTLPPTPAEQFRRDAKFTLPTATQGQSPLLTLPAEIRRMIFNELLGDKLVHIHLRHKDDKYEREGAPSKVSRWVHCVCHHGHKIIPHYHEEKNHQWCLLSTDILRTCQSAYLQGLPVLYQTNTFSFRCVKDVRVFEGLFVHFSSLAQSIDLCCTQCGCYTEHICHHHEHSGSGWRIRSSYFDHYYRLFLTTSSSSGNIRTLRLYFENSDSASVYHRTKSLLLSYILPVAQIQIFVPGELDERTDNAIRVEATRDQRNRISVIRHAKDLNDCSVQMPGEEVE